MMWLEALLSSLLLSLSLLLLLHSSPASTDPLADAAAYWSLSDRAVALAELGADAGPSPLAGRTLDDDELTKQVFPIPEPFCYRWQWLEPSVRGLPAPVLASKTPDPACDIVFSSSPSRARTLERGVWRQGMLQFLKVEQAERN